LKGIGNSDSRVNAVHQAAMEAHAAGLCILPPAENGSKRPFPNEEGVWGPYQISPPTRREMGNWYPGRSGLGMVTGEVSGRREAWDFDDRPTYEAFKVAAQKSGLNHVVNHIEAGYCDDTAGGGVRWVVEYPADVERGPGAGMKLARHPKREEERKDPNDKIKTLIELPGYAVLAPSNGSVHPSGKPYVRRSGSFSTIASYTLEERDALIALARSFDEMPRTRMGHEGTKTTQKQKAGNRPGDEYTRATTWEEVLEPKGWKKVFTHSGVTHWRRPGKTIGTSATTNFAGTDLLKVFTTSSEFDTEHTYDRFAAYAVLEHGGDFKAAARSLAAVGYGKKAPLASAPAVEPSEIIRTVGKYRDTKSGIEWQRQTQEGPHWTPLTNFRARIVFDVTQDDGVETIRALEIEAAINGRQHSFSVSAARFGQMNWILEHLGAEAAVEPGQGTKDRARHAIQVLSGRIPQRRVFTHTGWRELDGNHVFMHGGGALGVNGPVDGVEVELPSALERYVLPDPPEGADLCDAVVASLAMRNIAPYRVMIPLLGAVHRAVLGGADFSNHLSGPTGAKKSELAAIAQQHFGPEMDARALPCSWSSTANALEAIAFAAKDVVLVIDDFVPQGTSADRARLNALADRLLRAQGNRSGRARMRSDTSLRSARWPRGLIVSTGEETPTGQSLRARLAITEVRSDDVNLEALTLAQRAAADGTYARAVAGYIKWLAPRLNEVRDELAALSRKLRRDLGVTHARTADVLAQLYASWVVWLKFVVTVGAASSAEADVIAGEVWATVTALGKEQQDLQRADDPVERFYSLLGAVLSSGKGHIASATNLDRGPPNADDAKALGWRRRDDGSWYAQGPCLGWWASDVFTSNLMRPMRRHNSSAARRAKVSAWRHKRCIAGCTSAGCFFPLSGVEVRHTSRSASRSGKNARWCSTSGTT
jgi:Domain of unknown function (DUF927)